MKKMRRSLSTILQLTIDNFDAISPRYCNQTYIESNDPTMIIMVNYHLNVHVNLFLEQKPPVLYADYI
ncbi:11963_t:CDS:2, partial [Entrophospora sp. SA101]